ncbi:MAG: hypothetical protein ACLSB9_20695 [Hydrogeniiclostridium mannosilyticum]
MVHVHQIHVFCRQAHGLGMGNMLCWAVLANRPIVAAPFGVGTTDQIGAVVVAGQAMSLSARAYMDWPPV